MKKLLLIISALLCGCVSGITRPSETIKNDKCVDMEEFEIFQVLDDGALANECAFDWDSLSNKCSLFNQTVFILNQDGVDYYDGQRIKILSGRCAIRYGVYKYISRDERSRTVPKLKFVDSKVPNPIYQEWLKNQETVE